MTSARYQQSLNREVAIRRRGEKAGLEWIQEVQTPGLELQ